MNYSYEEAKKLLESEGYVIDTTFSDQNIHSLQVDELVELSDSGDEFDVLTFYFSDKISIAAASEPLILSRNGTAVFDNTTATDAGAVTGTYSGFIFNQVDAVPSEPGAVQIIAYKFKIVD